MIDAGRHLAQAFAFLLFAAAPLPFCLFVASRRDRAGLAPIVVVTLTTWCAVQALVAHGLGLLHALHFAAMTAAEIGVFAAGWLLAARHGGFASWRLPRPSLSALEKAVIVAAAAMGLTLLWWVAAMPVVDWDSWAFHLPTMVDWLQSGTFIRFEQYADRPRYVYPYGWEAICVLFLTPFDEDLLVAFPNLLAWALLGAATFSLARIFGARRVHALACSAMLLAMRALVVPIDTMHVDAPFAALLTAAVFFGVEWGRRGGDVDLGLAAAATGLACATRTTGPAYVALVILAVLLARAFRSTTAAASAPRSPALAAGGLAAGLALASFWYVKNAIELGHPLGSAAPHAGAASSVGSWADLAAGTLAGSVDPLHLASWVALYERSLDELALPFAGLALITALWPLAWIRGGAQRRDLVPFALGLASLLLFCITPYSAMTGIQVRLGLPFLAFLAVFAALAATRLGLRPEIPVAFALLSAVATFGSSRVFYPFAAVAIVAVVWARPISLRRHGPTLAVLLAVALVGGTMAARARRERERASVYDPAYAWLEQNVAADAAVAHFGGDRSYLFYGRHLQRRVIYAPKSESESARAWNARLRQRGVDVVAVGPWFGDDAPRVTVEALVAAGALSVLHGHGGAGEVTFYRLTSMDSASPVD